MMIGRSAEAEAFFAAIEATAPEVVSACDGWTAHEIAAHVTGNAVEIVRHLEPYLQGDPVPETRSFEEREAPLRALAHADLLARLDRDEQHRQPLANSSRGTRAPVRARWLTGSRDAAGAPSPR
jgi:hypothetical protein